MSASHIIEMWEHGRVEEPPAFLSNLLRGDERLLWVARLRSVGWTLFYARAGLFLLVAAVLFMLLAPWRESLHEYCQNDGQRCRGLYYILWPGALFIAANALVLLWQSWKSKYRPTVISYAVTTRRALLVDESRLWDPRFVYLGLHPVQFDRARIVFQGSKVLFVGLDGHASARAIYWVREGLRSVRAVEEAT